jgi:hypothetical protein
MPDFRDFKKPWDHRLAEERAHDTGGVTVLLATGLILLLFALAVVFAPWK